ncbi:MAG: DUF763 domain-containing protein [Chloroflexi bacterium]|nr:DUF763 domain-containing protein [Chloroflexota bacterium]
MTTPRRTGIAHLPLHGGKAPAWLFQRMTRLAKAMCIALVEEKGPEDVLERLSHPYWFQALGCVLGFDWHSSGVTTTVCGALKEGLRDIQDSLGLYVAGGKGATSRKTPAEVRAVGERLGQDLSGLVYASRMAAKVDTAALQDGYQLYHHTFLFTSRGLWAVVQQGMNEETRYARRYHWLGSRVTDFVCEPHNAVCSEATGTVLNLVAQESAEARAAITHVDTQERPEQVVGELHRLQALDLPARHHLALEDIHPEHIVRALLSSYERKPSNFEGLLALEGLGAKTVRALSLVAELVYGAPASVRDPALYSFAHGGKDGHPYPVDRRTYDATIAFMETALRRATMGDRDRVEALRRLYAMWERDRDVDTPPRAGTMDIGTLAPPGREANSGEGLK